MTELMRRRRALMAMQESPVYGYDVIGNPTISGNVLTPVNGGYIRSKREFSSADTWKIQFNVKTTNGTTGQNVFMMTDENGDRIRGVQCQWFYNSTNGLKLNFYLSSDGTNWDIASSWGFPNLSANTDYLVQIRFTGTKYQTKISTDGGTVWSSWNDVASTASIYGSGYLSFGCASGSTPALSGTIDLSKIKVWVNDSIWWQPVKPSSPEQFPYKFVDYIENAGDSNSWIELNVVPDNTFGFRAVVSIEERSGDVFVFGTRETTNGRIVMSVSGENKKPYLGWGGSVSALAYCDPVEWNTPFVAQLNYKNDRKPMINDKNTFNGNLSAIGFTPTWPFVLLGTHTTSGYTGRQCRLYECKISSGSNMIRDLRPCYRISDNAIGLYDMVTESFYANSGTGNLVKGNDLYVDTNPSANVSEILTVAESYLNQTGIQYNDGNTPIYLSTQTNGIDCSTFIMFCLLGIPFSDSPYSTSVYGGPYALTPNLTDYDWAQDPMLFGISRYIDGSSPDEMIRLACQLGRWFSERCKVIPLSNGFSAAQPGDLVWYASKNPDTGDWRNQTWWKHINHIAMVYSVEDAPDNYSYVSDGQTVTIPWDKVKYPYKHTIIDCGGTTPPCRTTQYLEIGQEDTTNVYKNNCNTVCLIVRTNL